jgi:hypothetical protein
MESELDLLLVTPKANDSSSLVCGAKDKERGALSRVGWRGGVLPHSAGLGCWGNLGLAGPCVACFLHVACLAFPF